MKKYLLLTRTHVHKYDDDSFLGTGYFVIYNLHSADIIIKVKV